MRVPTCFFLGGWLRCDRRERRCGGDGAGWSHSHLLGLPLTACAPRGLIAEWGGRGCRLLSQTYTPSKKSHAYSAWNVKKKYMVPRLCDHLCFHRFQKGGTSLFWFLFHTLINFTKNKLLKFFVDITTKVVPKHFIKNLRWHRTWHHTEVYAFDSFQLVLNHYICNGIIWSYLIYTSSGISP